MVIIFSCRFTKHHSGSGALITKEAARGGGRRDVGKVCVLGFVAQLCLTLCDPTNCSPPGSSVHGILQGKILEWVNIPFSKVSSQPRN